MSSVGACAVTSAASRRTSSSEERSARSARAPVSVATSASRPVSRPWTMSSWPPWESCRASARPKPSDAPVTRIRATRLLRLLCEACEVRRRHVLPAVALLDRAAEASRPGGGEVELHARLRRGGEDEPRVLLRRLCGEVRREVAGEDGGRLRAQVPEVQWAAGDRGEEILRIDAQALRQRDHLGGGVGGREYPAVEH